MKNIIKLLLLSISIVIFTSCSDKSSRTTEYQNITGLAVDNYIKNATVCIDTNLNNTCSDEESKYITTTDDNGSFAFSNIIKSDDMVIIAYLGKDVKTKEDFKYILKNNIANLDKNNKLILSSLSTLVVDYQAVSNETFEESKLAVINFISHVEDNVTVQSIMSDVIANKDTQKQEFLSSLKLFQMVETLNQQANVTNDSSQSAISFASIAKAIFEDKTNTLKHDSLEINVTREGNNFDVALLNTKPVFMNIPNPTILSGMKRVFSLDFVVDPNDKNIVYSIKNIDDKNLFEILDNGTMLYFKSIPSYDTNSLNEYKITLEASNGTNTVSKVITIKVSQDISTEYLSPTNIELTNYTITENNAENFQVGVLSTVDSDSDNFEYILVSGTGDEDNHHFRIEDDKLIVLISTNYEVKSSYYLRINTSDGINDFAKTFTISILDEVTNVAPVIISANLVNVIENQTSVITIIATDENNDTLVYDINNTDDFNINGSSGVVTFKSAPDYEQGTNNYTLLVSASDSEQTVTQVLTVNVIDNVTSTGILLSNNEVYENKQIGYIVGTLSTQDIDTNNHFTYSLGNAQDDTHFLIDNDKLVLNESPDYNTQQEYNITISSFDGDTTISEIFIIKVIDVNESIAADEPFGISISENSIIENNDINDTVGILSTEETNVSSGYTYSIVSGVGDENNDLFTIYDNKLNLNISANFESLTLTPIYKVRIMTTDNDLHTYSRGFEITINNTNDIATFNIIPAQFVDEDTTYIYNIIANDEDGNLILGTGHTATPLLTGFKILNIDGNNTQDLNITVEAEPIDADVGDHELSINIIQTDINAVISKSFTLTVEEVNDAPTYPAVIEDVTIEFGQSPTFNFAIDDGDSVAIQDVNFSVVSSNTTIATASVNAGINNNGTVSVTITGLQPGDANITVTLIDNGNTGKANENNTSSFKFAVEVRSSGWKIYDDNNVSSPITPVIFDGESYIWNETDLWYETTNHILLPIKAMLLGTGDDERFESNNKGNNVYLFDGVIGHYYVKKGEYLIEERRTIQHNINTEYNTTIEGSTIQAIDKNFQHDPVHNVFVSTIIHDSDSPNGRFYNSSTSTANDGWIDETISTYVDANESNSTYALAKDNYETDTISVDTNNSGNDICSRIYGDGWRIPTSYEMGIKVDITGENGYIPAYVGQEGLFIKSSTRYDSDKNWILANDDGTSSGEYDPGSTNIRCIYPVF